jgi:hypothetical protein
MKEVLFRTALVVGLIGLVSTVPGAAQSEGVPAPVTPDASPEAKALLGLLLEISGKCTLTGQHNYPNTTAHLIDA